MEASPKDVKTNTKDSAQQDGKTAETEPVIAKVSWDQQDGKTAETEPVTAKVSSDQHSNILELTRLRPELVEALGLPTAFLDVGAVSFAGDIVVQVPFEEIKNTLLQIVRNINLNSMPRDEACKAIVNHLRHVYPKYNVMIVYSQHLQSFQDCAHFHIELKLPIIPATVGYEVYIFKRGYFTLLGDGGFINWCFDGNFKRDGKSVEFFDI